MQWSERVAEPGKKCLLRCGIQPDLFPGHGGTIGSWDMGLTCLSPEVRDASDGAVLDYYPRVRGAVLCMVTAAYRHGLLPEPPRALWLGVPLRVHVPKRDPADLRVLRWSNRPAFEVGVEPIGIRDVSVLCTNRERTLVDLVRYGRHLGGSAIAARCLRAYSASGGREAAVRCMADEMRIPRPARLVLDALILGMDTAP